MPAEVKAAGAAARGSGRSARRWSSSRRPSEIAVRHVVIEKGRLAWTGRSQELSSSLAVRRGELPAARDRTACSLERSEAPFSFFSNPIWVCSVQFDSQRGICAGFLFFGDGFLRFLRFPARSLLTLRHVPLHFCWMPRDSVVQELLVSSRQTDRGRCGEIVMARLRGCNAARSLEVMPSQTCESAQSSVSRDYARARCRRCFAFSLALRRLERLLMLGLFILAYLIFRNVRV